MLKLKSRLPQTGSFSPDYSTRPANQVEQAASRAASEVSVSVQNVTKRYPAQAKTRRSKRRDDIRASQVADGVIANQSISLEIQRGEIFGLLGSNGAGKTTLVNQLLGLTKPTDGTILVEDIDVIRYPQQVKEIVSYLPQQGLAFGGMEVWRALNYTGQLRGLSKVAALAQADQLIQQLALTEVADRYVRKLSGGMQRMVGFATALMGHPKLLVLDEPTNQLDPLRRRLVWDTIRSINRQNGLTCILVTHNVLEAESVIGRLAILNRGKIVALGTPGELKQHFSHQAMLDLSLKMPLAKDWCDSSAAKISISNPSSIIPALTQLFAGANLDGAIVHIQPHPNQNPAQVRIFLPVERSDTALHLLTHRLGLEYLDDFKLTLPSLEEVYLQITGSTQSDESSATEHNYEWNTTNSTSPEPVEI